MIRIEVTLKDVTDAGRMSPHCCPVRRAFERAVPGSECAVAHEWLSYGPWAARRLVRLPAWVTARIRAYDRGEGMSPFAFDLEEPSGSLPSLPSCT